MYHYKTRKCQRCWKEIKATWGAKYCNQCRKIRDDEIYKAQHEREKEAKKLK